MKNYPIANIKAYGYKDRKYMKKAIKIGSLVIVLLSIFMIYLPIIMLLIQSVNSSTDISKFESFTLKWYLEIFTHKTLGNAIFNTFLVTIIAVVLATILGTLIAIGIHYFEKKKQARLLMLNNIPMLNADIVSGISLMLVFSCLLPIFPYLFGPFTMIFAHIFFTLPYVILSVLPKLREMDPFLIDASLDLGLKPVRTLIKVIVPAIKSGIFSGLLLALTMSLDDFVISYYTTGNGFNNFSIFVYSSIGRRSLTPAVYAYSTLLTLITILFVVVYQVVKKKRGHKHA